MEQILQLTSFGARLRVKDGLFRVTVPDLTGGGNEQINDFPAHQVQTILLHRHTSISADAILLAQEHQVDIYILGDFDLPEAYVAPQKAPSSVHILKRQLALLDTPAGLEMARYWLAKKVQHKMEWLEKIRSYRNTDDIVLIDRCLQQLREQYVRICQLPIAPRSDLSALAATLRGMEGSASRQYLDTLARMVPEHLRFDGRSRRPAADIFNAALNYGYGILYRWVEKAIWEAGLNPYFGCMHTVERNQKSLLYDMVEPFRPWVDRSIFTLCSRKALQLQHTEPYKLGIGLNKTGRKLVTGALRERFEHATGLFHGKKWSLKQCIRLEARQFAVILRKYDASGPPTAWSKLLAEYSHAPNIACAVCEERIDQHL